jgi:outer membrane lipoprotein-sorting protein
MQREAFLSIIVMSSVLFSSKGWSDTAMTQEQADAAIKEVDERQRNSGDYKSLSFVKETERKKEPRLFQAMVYRRDDDDKFMILFVKPKEEAGKAYLKIDKNLWNFQPGTGKWERRTEREKLAGTNSRRSDFDESRLSEEYTTKYQGADKLGSYQVYKFKLTAKEGVDVAYPILSIWVDQKDRNLLKREEYSLSGKLMRTAFYPKWKKQFSPSKNADVWIPEEIRIFDELEKENTTVVLIKETDLGKLEENIFTKAWIESKSK